MSTDTIFLYAILTFLAGFLAGLIIAYARVRIAAEREYYGDQVWGPTP